MPYNIEWKNRIVVFDYSGIVTSQDILRSNQEAYGDMRFDQIHWEVVLFDSVERIEFLEKDVKKIAYLDMAAYRTNPNITVVFVGDSEIVRELFELYESIVQDRSWPAVLVENRRDVWREIGELSGNPS